MNLLQAKINIKNMNKNEKITCKYCGEEFENKDIMENSEQHMCMVCGNRQDYTHCKKLKGECIECK